MSKNNTIPAKPLDAYLQEFKAAFGNAVESIAKCARIYAAAVIAHPDKAKERFHEAYPAVTDATWEKMRLVGNGDAHPAIMLCTDRIALRIARMTMEKQRELLDGKTALKCVNRTTGVVESVHLSDLKPRHEAVLFDGTHARTVAEQRAYIAESAKAAKTAPTPPYRVEGALLIVTRACRIGVKELRAILKQMTAKEA